MASNCEQYLDNFNENSNVKEWYEVSDIVRKEGKSKATLILQETKLFKRAIMFTLINPQPCGAGFAGMSRKLNDDLSSYKMISLQIRNQGAYDGYKFVLRQKNDKNHYCVFFTAPKEFDVVTVKLEDFKPYFEGQLVNTTEKLNLANLDSMGLQTYGGVYLPQKQSGVASLEIDWIKIA